jgi:hypothetical protein
MAKVRRLNKLSSVTNEVSNVKLNTAEVSLLLKVGGSTKRCIYKKSMLNYSSIHNSTFVECMATYK